MWTTMVKTSEWRSGTLQNTEWLGTSSQGAESLSRKSVALVFFGVAQITLVLPAKGQFYNPRGEGSGWYDVSVDDHCYNDSKYMKLQ